MFLLHRKDHICECYCLGPVQRGHDPDCGLQHEEDHQGERDDKALGYRRPAKVPVDVGALLPRGERDRVHGGRRGPRQDRGEQERAAQSPGQTPAGGDTHPGPRQQEGPSR